MPATRRRDSALIPYLEETLAASAAKTTTGQTATLSGWGATDRVLLQVNVTAVSGTTPSMTLTIEDSLDGTNWRPAVVSSAAITATGTYFMNIATGTNFADRIRLKWTITGTTPSFTFSVLAASWVD